MKKKRRIPRPPAGRGRAGRVTRRLNRACPNWHRCGKTAGAPKFFNAGGTINDARAVKIGMTNASLFAYVADGRNGLRVLQLTAPNRTEGLWGFSPPPEPELIATFRTKGEAVDISKGLDRDRAVDESGNQLAVFGRRGARPFHLDEMQRLYLRDGRLYTVTDQPPRRPA